MTREPGTWEKAGLLAIDIVKANHNPELTAAANDFLQAVVDSEDAPSPTFEARVALDKLLAMLAASASRSSSA